MIYKVKDCPFCLKPAIQPYRHDQGGWVMTCDNACCLVWRSTVSSAVNDWNARAEPKAKALYE